MCQIRATFIPHFLFPPVTTSTANRQLLCRLNLQYEHALQHPFALSNQSNIYSTREVNQNGATLYPKQWQPWVCNSNHLIKQQFRRSANKELITTSLISSQLNHDFCMWSPYQLTAVITRENLSLARRCTNAFSRRDKHWFITWSFHCSNLF